MKKFRIFIVDKERNDGGTVHVDNDVVVSNAMRKPLPNNPDGWNDMAIGWERNMTYFGVVRNFSLVLSFVRDGAKILRKTFFKENVERKLSILITMVSLVLTDLTFAFNYLFLYKGDLDFSTCIDEATKVSINVMEGGTSALLKANEGTIYPIPLDDPETRLVYCDGIELVQRVNYAVTDGVHYGDPITIIDMPILTSEGKSAEVVNFSQTADAVLFSGFTDYRHNSTNYFIQNKGTTVIATKLKGRVFIKFNGIAWSLFATSRKFYLKIVGNETIVTGGSYVIDDPVIGQTYTVDLDLDANLFGVADQRYFFVFQLGDAAGDAVGCDIEFLPDSRLTSEFVSRFPATFVPMLTLYHYYRKLTGKITGDPEDAVSTLLLANLNMCITCGDAIRGFKDINGKYTGTIRSKMTDFFTASNVEFNAGLGVELNKLVLEKKEHFFDYSNPVPLGEVKGKPKTSFAVDLMANTFKFGSDTQDYEDINGRDEFNNTYLFSSDITRVVREYNLVSPYRRDCYGFEYTRINFDGKETTDSDSDNDVWIVNTDQAPSATFHLLFFGITFETIAPNVIKIPVENVVMGPSIIISDTGTANDGTFNVSTVSYAIAGFTIVTVAGTLIDRTGSGNLYTNEVQYVLRRGTYDTITGLLSPGSVFNIEDMTSARLIEKHGNWIHAMMQGFDNKALYFQSTEKNKELFTSKNGKVYDEDADVPVSSLAAPLFNPRYFEIEMKVPVNLPALLENNPSKCFSFTWQGQTFKGFLIKAGISLSDNAQQVFKLLSTPDNDFTSLT